MRDCASRTALRLPQNEWFTLRLGVDLTTAGDPYKEFVSDITEAELTVIHKGEHGGDQSNNGFSKGLFDNQMNLHQPPADAFARVDRHIMGLVKYFDKNVK